MQDGTSRLLSLISLLKDGEEGRSREISGRVGLGSIHVK